VAGVIRGRLRLTTSRTPAYWRGGVKIGTLNAPTYVLGHEITAGQLLAVFLDPNIDLAFETEEGRFEPVSAEERETKIEGLRQTIELDGPDRTIFPAPDADQADLQPNTVEPQGDGSAPEGGHADAEASQVSGMGAAPDTSDGSAADAGTTEPTAQSDPPAPEPAPPVRAGRAKPKPVKAKP
jgi:hypothetical protein